MCKACSSPDRKESQRATLSPLAVRRVGHSTGNLTPGLRANRITSPSPSSPSLALGSGHLDVMVPQWERADALARRLEERIEHRGRGHGNGRLAYAAPESTGR